MQNFERKSLQDSSRRPAARALMTLLACSPAAQTYAAKGFDTLFSLMFFCCYLRLLRFFATDFGTRARIPAR